MATITPLQANLGWVVSWDKGPFRGRDALLAEREAGPRRRLRGLVTDGRRPPREGSVVRRAGVRVGEVTSGNFSPELGHGIALAFEVMRAVGYERPSVTPGLLEHWLTERRIEARRAG